MDCHFAADGSKKPVGQGRRTFAWPLRQLNQERVERPFEMKGAQVPRKCLEILVEVLSCCAIKRAISEVQNGGD